MRCSHRFSTVSDQTVGLDAKAMTWWIRWICLADEPAQRYSIEFVLTDTLSTCPLHLPALKFLT